MAFSVNLVRSPFEFKPSTHHWRLLKQKLNLGSHLQSNQDILIIRLIYLIVSLYLIQKPFFFGVEKYNSILKSEVMFNTLALRCSKKIVYKVLHIAPASKTK